MSDTQINPDWRVSKIDIQSFFSNTDVYVIVEPQLWEKWKFWLYKYVVDPQFAFLFDDTPYAHIDTGPVVMNLSASAELFNICISQMGKTPCGCFVRAKKNQDWQTILDNLRHAISVSSERSNALLRYYEPRTLLPLFAVMTDEERAAHFYSIEKFVWYYKDWLQSNIPEGLLANGALTPWKLTDKEINQMQTVLTQW